jgi:hypothetical protein
MHTRKKLLLILGVVVLIALLACNFPGISTQGDAIPDSQPDQGSGPVDTQPPPVDIAPSPGLSTVTVKSGTGYIFSTQQETPSGDDYDIYWNNAEICALSSRSAIVSMGVMGNLSAVAQISTQGMEPTALVPTEGEVFAVRLKKGEGTEYAVIRLIGYGDDNAIILEYIYPFQGTVNEGP